MTISPDDLYLGGLNSRALEPQRRGPVGLYDTTLRDGEQAVGVALDPEQKLEIARLLDGLGIERIEAGFPRVSEDDARAIELIAGAGLDAEIWGFSRAVQADVEALVELGVRYSVIEAPVSDLKLKAYGVERDADGLLAVAQRRVVEADRPAPLRFESAAVQVAQIQLVARDAHARTIPSGKEQSFSASPLVISQLSSTRSPPPPSQ